MQDYPMPDFNQDYYHQSSGGIINEQANEGLLRRNNELYNNLKSGNWQMHLGQGQNIEYLVGREDDRLYVRRKQHNVEAIRQWCQAKRQANEQGITDLLAPPGPDGRPQHMWVNLPKIIAREISDRYFNGWDWEVIKRDPEMKTQWYMVIQREYPDFVCYPGGRLPIPRTARYPTERGGAKSLFARR